MDMGKSICPLTLSTGSGGIKLKLTNTEDPDQRLSIKIRQLIAFVVKEFKKESKHAVQHYKMSLDSKKTCLEIIQTINQYLNSIF